MRRSRGRTTNARARRGLTMVEIIVALTIFGVASLAMIGLATNVSVRGRETASRAKRDAILEAEVNRLMALPFNQLNGLAGPKSVPHALLPYTRTVTLEANAAADKFLWVKLKVSPLDGSAADSIKFTRSKNLPSPICYGC